MLNIKKIEYLWTNKELNIYKLTNVDYLENGIFVDQ